MIARPRLMRRLMVAMGWLLVAAAVSACSPFAVVGNVFTAGSAVPAKYTLPQGKTVLVLVDDPQNVLGNPRLTQSIAAQTNFQLKQHFDKIKLVSVRDLASLQTKLGNRYSSTPMVTIARDLGADVLIHVEVETVTLRYAYTVYRPTASVRVKVIDATTLKRLFPSPGPVRDQAIAQPGYPLLVHLPSQTVNQSQPGAVQAMTRSLAKRIGVKVAELFYDHAKDTDFTQH